MLSCSGMQNLRHHNFRDDKTAEICQELTTSTTGLLSAVPSELSQLRNDKIYISTQSLGHIVNTTLNQ